MRRRRCTPDELAAAAALAEAVRRLEAEAVELAAQQILGGSEPPLWSERHGRVTYRSLSALYSDYPRAAGDVRGGRYAETSRATYEAS